MHTVKESLVKAGLIDAAGSPELLKNNYEHTNNFDPRTNLLLAFKGDEPCAYTTCWWDRDGKTAKISFTFALYTRPDQTDQVGQTMLSWALERIKAIYLSLGEPTEAFINASADDCNPAQIKLLEKNGFKPARYYYFMTRDLINEPIPDLPLPTGLALKPAAIDDYRKIWDASTTAFIDEWDSIEYTETNYQGWINNAHFQPYLWQIAWDGDKPVGMITNYVDLEENQEKQRRRGYTEDIWVLKDYRRRGIAGALLARSLAMFKLMNLTEASLSVDTENPSGANRLYTNLGFKPYRTEIEFRKTLIL